MWMIRIICWVRYDLFVKYFLLLLNDKINERSPIYFSTKMAIELIDAGFFHHKFYGFFWNYLSIWLMMQRDHQNQEHDERIYLISLFSLQVSLLTAT